MAETTLRGEPKSRKLTYRDLDVVELLGAGYSNNQIAEHLGLTEGTIKVYVSRVMAKLKLHSRLQVGLWSRDNGSDRKAAN